MLWMATHLHVGLTSAAKLPHSCPDSLGACITRACTDEACCAAHEHAAADCVAPPDTVNGAARQHHSQELSCSPHGIYGVAAKR